MTTHDPVRRALSALKDADRARHAPPEIDRLVLEAFDSAVREGHTAKRSTTTWTTRFIGIAAAVIMIVSSLVYVLEWHRQTSSAPTDQALAARAPDLRARPDETLPSTVPSPPQVNAGADRARRPGSSDLRRIVPRRIAPRETDGTPFMNGEFDDVVRVVRVRLPRATLSSLGIAVIDPGAAGTVDLEVLVGVDGLARTIRMVR
jgi:hypothetical protein